MCGRERSCTGKNIYYTQLNASKAAEYLSAEYDKEMEAYQCYFCHMFHVGKKTSEIAMVDAVAHFLESERARLAIIFAEDMRQKGFVVKVKKRKITISGHDLKIVLRKPYYVTVFSSNDEVMIEERVLDSDFVTTMAEYLSLLKE